MDDALKKAFVVSGALALWAFLTFLSHGPIDMSSSSFLQVQDGQVNQANPFGTVTLSFHDAGYEDSWIQDVDQKEGIVIVTTIDSKMNIVFKPAANNLKKFRVGWIAPVTFECTKLKKGKCDFESPYKLFVLNGPVEVKRLIFTKK